MTSRHYPKKQPEGDWFFDGHFYDEYPGKPFEEYQKKREKVMERKVVEQTEYYLPPGKELNFD